MEPLPSARDLAWALLLAVPYVLLAFFPLEIGRWIAQRLRAREPASLWDLSETVRRRRILVRWSLTATVAALAGVAAGLLGLVRETHIPGLSDPGLVLMVLALGAAVAALARLRAAGLGAPAFPGTQEPELAARVRRAVEGVAVAAGIPPPAVEVVAGARPTALTLLRPSGPAVLVTSALARLLPAAELEAVAAHEVGHVVSGGLVETQTMETLLDAVRLLGTVALWLFLLTRPGWFGGVFALLTLLISLVMLRVLLSGLAESGGRPSGRLVEAVILLVTPPLVVANVLAELLHFAVGQAEDLLADLKAVELTRHPEALHAALRRLHAAPATGPPMPIAYHTRYFTAHGTLPSGFPAAQAPAEIRLAVLERLDPSLRVAQPVRPVPHACPDCRTPLAPLTVASHYGAPIHVDRCAQCGGIWFDDLELYLTGATALIDAGGTPAGVAPATPLRCPRCAVALCRMPPVGLPGDVWIWECGTCGGAWVRPPDLGKFGAFRIRRAARRVRPGGRRTETPAPWAGTREEGAGR